MASSKVPPFPGETCQALRRTPNAFRLGAFLGQLGQGPLEHRGRLGCRYALRCKHRDGRGEVLERDADRGRYRGHLVDLSGQFFERGLAQANRRQEEITGLGGGDGLGAVGVDDRGQGVDCGLEFGDAALGRLLGDLHELEHVVLGDTGREG